RPGVSRRSRPSPSLRVRDGLDRGVAGPDVEDGRGDAAGLVHRSLSADLPVQRVRANAVPALVVEAARRVESRERPDRRDATPLGESESLRGQRAAGRAPDRADPALGRGPAGDLRAAGSVALPLDEQISQAVVNTSTSG